MTTPAQWLEGARPRTLPAALAPVIAGSGAAAGLGSFDAVTMALCALLALALQVAVNCAGILGPCKTLSKGELFPLSLWNQVIAVNLTGTFNVIRHASLAMSRIVGRLM